MDIFWNYKLLQAVCHWGMRLFNLLPFLLQGSFQLQDLLIVRVKIVTSLMCMHRLRELLRQRIHHFKLLSWFLMKMITVHLLKSKNTK